MKSTTSVFATLAVATLAASVFAGQPVMAAMEWTGFRGPNRDDVSTETGLLKEWPAAGPKLLWKIDGVGIGYSTVSIAGGKIITMGDQKDSSYIYALDMTGKQLWSAKVGKPGGSYPGTRCTPTIDGDRIYALGQFGDLVCVSAADGKEIWRSSFKELGSKNMPGWQYCESPLVDGNMMVCTPGGPSGAVAALNKMTGAKIWQSAEIKDSCAYASLVPAVIGNVRQYIQLSDSNVYAVGAADGKLLWKAPRKGSTAVVPTPIYFDNHVFVTSGYGVGCNCFKIDSEGGAFKATQVYASKDIINHHGGVVRVGNYIYGHSDNGSWTCLEMKTGTVKWQEQGVGKGAVTYADGHLYTRSEGQKGTVALVSASPDGYKEHGRFNQPNRSKEASWAHPVICDGKLYLRDMDILLCYDVKGN